MTDTYTATYTATRTSTPTHTITYTDTPTCTFTPTTTPTNTPVTGIYAIVPGEIFTSFSPGYIGTPAPQEAGRVVTISVRAVEKNYWTTLNISDTIGISSSQNAWTVLDVNRNLANGEVDFYVRFLRAGVYAITANDLTGNLGGCVTDSISVTVNGYGNTAQIADAVYNVYSAVQGQTNIKVMDLTITNPNSGGASFIFTGVTLTASGGLSSAFSMVTVKNSSGTQLSHTVWGAAKQVFVPVNVQIDPLQSQTVSIILDISPSAPDGSYSAAVSSASDVLVSKLDGSVQYVESTTGNFPYTSANINITSAKLESSFYNYPNPFKAGAEKTVIRYYLSHDAKVSLKIYDLMSRRVKTVIENDRESGGNDYTREWDGKNDDGKVVLDGVYYGVLQVEGKQYHIKIVVVK